jgi:lipopolysaccharide/colanic/teichoic acid biosynthesis glycosyltransferase
LFTSFHHRLGTETWAASLVFMASAATSRSKDTHIIMNKPEHIIPPPYAVLPKQRSSSYPTAGSDPGSAKQRDSVARPALFLAWSNVHELTANQANCGLEDTRECVAEPPLVPFRSRRLDRGLWLLQDAFARRESWSRLNAVPVAVPLPYQLSHRPNYAAVKRAADVAGSLVLLTLLLPVFVLIAVLIRLDSPGPAFFHQRRSGKDGEEFLLWKFRSMRSDAPKYAPSPTSNLDRRLTRIGRLLRRVSIDELPQLINVLKGEMSLVGPRPEMPFIVNRYTSFERRRLAVKPGITGLWQVSPARAHPIHENLQYDLHYIHHQNLVLDGAILLRTIAAVIRGVGAV